MQEYSVESDLSQAVPFELGQVVATPGALALVHDHLVYLGGYLRRHRVGDWGMLDSHDILANNAATKNGTRILSAYETGHGRLWIITEGDRSVTTFLLPSEY